MKVTLNIKLAISNSLRRNFYLELYLFPYLHLYIPQERPNQYEQVLRAIGNIITDYDTDKLIPAFGFGAMNTPGGTDGRVADDFPLNGQPQSPYCTGVEGVIQVI